MSRPCSIYCVADPRWLEVRYVGSTINPAGRFDEHRRCGTSIRSSHWAAELRALGAAPVCYVVAVVDEEQRVEAEQQWIDYFRAQGHPLLNRHRARPPSRPSATALPTKPR